MLKNVQFINFNSSKCHLVHKYLIKQFSKLNGALIGLDFDQGNLFETTACNISMSMNKNISRKYYSFNKFNKNKRSVIEEASRILREDIKDISLINSSRLDFLIIPGGKIFDDLLIENFDLNRNEILSDLSRVIRDFKAFQKPILFSSNSSLLACKILGKNNLGPGLTVTYGAETIEWNNKSYIKYAIDQGNEHKIKTEKEHCVDLKNSIVTIPGTLKSNYNLKSILNSFDKGIMAIYNHIKNPKK